MIGPTGDQYEDVEGFNDEAVNEFIEDIKELPSPCDLLKYLKKLIE